jgi:hypothetical protein
VHIYRQCSLHGCYIFKGEKTVPMWNERGIDCTMHQTVECSGIFIRPLDKTC